jgi:hypothetical protein
MCTCTLIAQNVQRTTKIQINEIHLDMSFENFCRSDELIWMSSRKLYPKDIFGDMSFHEGPLGMLALQQTRRHGHLTHR